VSGPISIGADFRHRYAVQRLRDGGVLVDLTTGTYSRLNTSAAEICSILAGSDEFSSARSRVAQLIGRNDEIGEQAIRDVVGGLAQLGPRREPLGAFRYVPSEQGGYVLTSNDAPRLWIAPEGTCVRLASPNDSVTWAQLFGYLRAVAPKVLFLQSILVIHGAASRTRRGIRIISGQAGAGKTTTARAFAAAGAELFAEDMLVVASFSPLHVHSAGENAINSWAAQAAERLSHSPHEKIETSTLRAAIEGEPTPVSEIWFIDGARRYSTGGDILPKRMGETDGALAMMIGLFLGGATPESWRKFLSLSGTIAQTIPLWEAQLPATLDELSVAAKRYTENSAS
jgi:hypothetical protein